MNNKLKIKTTYLLYVNQGMHRHYQARVESNENAVNAALRAAWPLSIAAAVKSGSRSLRNMLLSMIYQHIAADIRAGRIDKRKKRIEMTKEEKNEREVYVELTGFKTFGAMCSSEVQRVTRKPLLA